jgi:DNA-binding NarL/FixJ family response regulator
MTSDVPTIRIAIADDHKIFRNGVISSLQPYDHIRIVCEAEGGASLLGKLQQEKVDVVLLDMKMPDMDGAEVCKKIKDSYPKVHVIGLSVYDHHYYIASMFAAGASGYLLKNVDPSEILKAIESTFTDGSYMHEKTPINLVKSLIDMNHPSVYFDAANTSPLKQHEIDVLKLITREYTNAEIAKMMQLSPKTVENYRNNLLTKTGAKNTAGLVTYAIKKGLVVV